MGLENLTKRRRVGVFSELASVGGLDGEALRERLGLHPRSATDFFDAFGDGRVAVITDDLGR